MFSAALPGSRVCREPPDPQLEAAGSGPGWRFVLRAQRGRARVGRSCRLRAWVPPEADTQHMGAGGGEDRLLPTAPQVRGGDRPPAPPPAPGMRTCGPQRRVPARTCRLSSTGRTKRSGPVCAPRGHTQPAGQLHWARVAGAPAAPARNASGSKPKVPGEGGPGASPAWTEQAHGDGSTGAAARASVSSTQEGPSAGVCAAQGSLGARGQTVLPGQPPGTTQGSAWHAAGAPGIGQARGPRIPCAGAGRSPSAASSPVVLILRLPRRRLLPDPQGQGDGAQRDKAGCASPPHPGARTNLAQSAQQRRC